MVSTKRVILSDPIIDAICDALEIDKHVTNRIVLTLEVGAPIVAEVTMYGTATFIEQNWNKIVKEAKTA